jgi:glycosidase
VILDGVFNHCGRGFFAFNDILENQEHSPYLDWFHITNFPVDGYSPGDARDYLGWWNIKSLPKFNTDNPHVRAYLLGVAQYWIRQGADGWRMDVPNEIDDDAFWSDFRRLVRAENPEAYLLGEIWNLDARWVGKGHFDGLMHYPYRDAVLRLLQTGTLDVPHFVKKLEQLTRFYPPENTRAMLTLLSSHDVERLLTKLENDLEKTRLAYLLQFTFPGAPSIYYGDEIGLLGGKDPGCRGAFPWDVKKWNHSLRDWVKGMIQLRRQHPVLRRGDFKTLDLCTHQSCCGYMRTDGDAAVLVAVNASAETHELQVPLKVLPLPAGDWENRVMTSLLYNSPNQMHFEQGVLTLKLAPWQGEVIGI